IFLFPLIIAFAILRYHLFDIRIILTELLVGIMGILLLVLPLIVPTNELKILATVLFLLFCIFGYLLIKTTHEQIQKKEELERAYNELKELDETKTMFFSIASHQLRTPLSAMKGYLSMVLSGDYGVKIEGQIKEFLEKVYQSNERLINLVNDLLDITRLQMGKLQLNSQPVQIEEIVQSVVDEFSEQARQKNLSLVFKKPSAPLPKINVDPQKIRQVILNLIDNAIKYTKKGGITVKVQHNFSTNSENGTILISVKDTGIGLTTKDINNLFQLFERSDSAVKTHAVGVGIGLYAAKEIVKAHKGKIWAESSGRDKGSTFYVELPVK
ncbi:MAG: HAMP domain-containing sensor histidine kinase, partial [Minisyncoccales bacterium]